MQPQERTFIVEAMTNPSRFTNILAVASGKGGVGKTTTSVNMALYFARRGLNTLLVDADPLSDIATLLDLTTPEESWDVIDRPLGVFQLLDLYTLGNRSAPMEVGERLSQLMESLEKKEFQDYRMIIIDLPAGILGEEGWDFLGRTDLMVVVTNDEPTSHVASGAFIRRAREESPDIPFRIWHNKYEGISNEGFDPKDLPGNYNRNVPEEDRLDFKALDLKDTAYIPKDPALDLLQASPDLNLNIKRQMLERVELLYRDRIGQILGIAPLSSRLARLLENLLFLLPRVDTVDQAMKELGDELTLLAGGDFFIREDNSDNLQLFAPREKEEIAQVLRLLKEDNLSRSLRRIRRLLEELLEEEENSQRLFFMGTESTKLKSLDREVSLLLGIINDKAPRGGTNLRNLGGLLLFDFTLFKLFESSTVRKLIEEFIPWTEDERGRKRRDKQKQIRWLVEKDEHYREKYLHLLKTLRPVMVQQLRAIAGVLETDSILFKKNGGIHQEVYLRLLTSFLHDVLNSGLGVVIGFRYRPASRAFQRGAEILLEELEGKKNHQNPGGAHG